VRICTRRESVFTGIEKWLRFLTAAYLFAAGAGGVEEAGAALDSAAGAEAAAASPVLAAGLSLFRRPGTGFAGVVGDVPARAFKLNRRGREQLFQLAPAGGTFRQRRIMQILYFPAAGGTAGIHIRKAAYFKTLASCL